MRQGLLLIQVKGKPDERITGDFSSSIAKYKAVAIPGADATLYELKRVKHKHIPLFPAAVKPPVTVEPVPVAPVVPAELPKPKHQFHAKGK